MSSVGQAVGGIVGGAIGFFVGGPAWALRGAQIGIMAGGIIDPPKGPLVRGPRLDDLSVQTSTYGAFIPRLYGTAPLSGNVFWVQGDKLIEEEVRSEGGKGGAPEPNTQTFSYYATFALGLCDCSGEGGRPIGGIRRIWMAGELWYDAGSDDFETVVKSNQMAELFTLYTGTDTQLPDPLIQADKGVANVPAYRGLTYLVFERLPLEKYGNSLAGTQMKIEVIGEPSLSNVLVKEFSIPAEAGWNGTLRNATNQYDNRGFSNFIATYTNSDGTWPLLVQRIGSATVSSLLTDADDPLLSGPAPALTGSGFSPRTPTSIDTFQYAFPWVDFSLNYFMWGSNGRLEAFYMGSSYSILPLTFAERNGVIYLVFSYSYGTNPYLFKMGSDKSTSDRLTLASSSILLPNFGVLSVWGESAVNLLRAATTGPVDVTIYGEVYDPVTGAGTLIETDAFSVTLPGTEVYNIGGDNNSAYVEDGKLYVVTSIAVGTSAPPAKVIVIDLVGQALIGVYSVPQSFPIITANNTPNMRVVDGVIYWGQSTTDASHAFVHNAWALDRISGAGVPLSSIVEAECLNSNMLTSGDLDVTDLTDTVRGYRVSALGAIRSSIDPLRSAFPFDVVQHGYDIKFKRRGSASAATITAGELDARGAGDSPGVQITDSREMDSMIPRRVSVSYLDHAREYDTGVQPYERINTDAIGERSVELPIVFTGDEAIQRAETLLYLYWLERNDVSLRLPPAYAHLEPADVITVVGEYATYELRIVGLHTLPDGRIECAAKYNRAALYTSLAVTDEGLSTGGALALSGPSEYVLLDIPLMRDADDAPGFVVAMSGFSAGWPGGVLYRSTDGGQTWADLRAFTAGGVIGYAIGALASHGGTMFDKASTLKVRVYAGALSSVTEAQMLAGQNWFAYGAHGRWEIIAAQNCVLQADGSYILTDFMRGQRGTEWATGLHADRDSLVLLDSNKLDFVNVNSSTIGSPATYRGITSGQSLDTDDDREFTYTGVNLECLSPVHLTGNRNPSTNDWTLLWTRRSRFDQWRNYVDAPLGEASESYEVDVFSSGTYTTLKRTLASSTPTVTYTSAQQSTDFGGNQATLYVKIYQLSATVGRGYPLTQSITR